MVAAMILKAEQQILGEMAHVSDPKRRAQSAQRKDARTEAKKERDFERLVLDVADHKVTMVQARTRNQGRLATDIVTTLRKEIETRSFFKHTGANTAMSATLDAEPRLWAMDQKMAKTGRFTDYDLDRPDLQGIGGLRKLSTDDPAHWVDCPGYKDPPYDVRRSAIVGWGDGGPHKINASGVTVCPELKEHLKKSYDGEEYYSGNTSVYVSTLHRAAVTAPHCHEDRVVLGLEFAGGELRTHLAESGAWQYLLNKYNRIFSVLLL